MSELETAVAAACMDLLIRPGLSLSPCLERHLDSDNLECICEPASQLLADVSLSFNVLNTNS